MRSSAVLSPAFVATAIAPVMSAPVATKVARAASLDVNFGQITQPLSPEQGQELSSMVQAAMDGTRQLGGTTSAPVGKGIGEAAAAAENLLGKGSGKDIKSFLDRSHVDDLAKLNERDFGGLVEEAVHDAGNIATALESDFRRCIVGDVTGFVDQAKNMVE
ncbi:hypothetical protein V8E55_004367 [Tylopilus felleus]